MCGCQKGDGRDRNADGKISRRCLGRCICLCGLQVCSQLQEIVGGDHCDQQGTADDGVSGRDFSEYSPYQEWGNDDLKEENEANLGSGNVSRARGP